jgi:hypothetical protein
MAIMTGNRIMGIVDFDDKAIIANTIVIIIE